MNGAALPDVWQRWLDAIGVYVRRDVLAVILLGFCSGLPLALSGSTLIVWMKEEGVDLTTIGLFAAVGTPYTLKFLWAPLVDTLRIPVLTRLLGRRRGWLLVTQLALIGAVLFLGSLNPKAQPALVALGALMVAAVAATLDIIIDAYRVERLDVSEQAAGMAGFIAAYRIGMAISTAGALYMVEGFEQWGGLDKAAAWRASFASMAVLIGVGILVTLFAREPETSAATPPEPEANPLRRVLSSAYHAFADFLRQDLALAVLAFVMFFKLCDAFAGTMTVPFVLDLGFTRVDYANYVKGLGLIATLLGGFAGGVVARGMALLPSLWLAAVLQTVSNLAFAWLALVGFNHLALATAIVIENFAGAVGTVIFVAYLSAQCRSIAHTATQYALLTALASVGRTYIGTGAGFLAQQTGWFWFFVLSCLTALPGLALLAYLQAKGHFNRAAAAPT